MPVFSDLACAIADAARVISDFRVMGDQRELLGHVASVATAWLAQKETAGGGDRRRLAQGHHRQLTVNGPRGQLRRPERAGARARVHCRRAPRVH
jgi:hypothetical protein